MIIKICDNLIINIDRIDHVFNNELQMIDGTKFKLNEIGLRNIQKVADEMQKDLFKSEQSNANP
ncbi:MAG: hypothetical protein WA079_04615 [Leuconostoc falkenbergense]|uniref:hypothetical protein n=1 Tax=Leuconostoc falkenbergense TaxID=2766470 RepID=UPI003BB5D43A